MILAILQARMSSHRLPGKVMKPILGQPMLLRQIERVGRAAMLGSLVIATSEDATDDPIERFCAEHGVGCFRGSLDDVLDRFYRVAKDRAPEYVVRLTGDCPLADPNVIDTIVRFCLDGDYDYATNAIQPSFPDGLDVEVFKFACLEAAWREATLPSQREHVTPFIHQQPGRFKIGHYRRPRDLSHLRWTVDEPADFELVRQVYELLYPVKPDFGTDDILELLERRPDLKMLNTLHQRNEGYRRSLEKDRQLDPKKGKGH